MLSPLLAVGHVLYRTIDATCYGHPWIPTILTGKNLVNISRDVDDGFGYRFTFASGKSVVIVRDRYHAPDYAYYHMPYPCDSHCGGMVGPVAALVWHLDYGRKDD